MHWCSISQFIKHNCKSHAPLSMRKGPLGIYNFRQYVPKLYCVPRYWKDERITNSPLSTRMHASLSTSDTWLQSNSCILLISIFLHYSYLNFCIILSILFTRLFGIVGIYIFVWWPRAFYCEVARAFVVSVSGIISHDRQCQNLLNQLCGKHNKDDLNKDIISRVLLASCQ